MRVKLIGFVMILLLLLGASARAEKDFRPTAAIFTGLRGREVNVMFERVRSSGEGVLQVLDAQDAVLGQKNVYDWETIGAVTVRVPRTRPPCRPCAW